ncbi:MAG: LptF/LptG family permease [Ignavibacteria bacterium]|nr:LptF/LptG family permease [Ignavibacteria bacterium]MBT8380867.1 LptF/LptG family permease [Ignavibacteria bacterium]MBT8391146.1 LptF/LptG family permease [Ignavibacteria bacterium]NNJ54269.1 YjgP/YjgQ family permease [Ignavibacteriaceae bacterium]NNL20234.1 YjgP/YjgQ family permease [Ignavibacteriaceae bacterium]
MIKDLYIIRAHILPFIFSMLTLFGILLLQFLMKFADKLIGKGLDTWLIVKLVVFNLSWMLVLVVPMSVLGATLMAFGNLSQNNEITVMKSSGVSIYRMMAAPFLASVLIAFLLFLFNDKVLPDANHQARVLMSDISRKKPTLSLEPGFFSQEVSNYAILVRKINENTNELSQVTIYDYTNPVSINVVTAKRGKIYFSFDQKNLIMDLQQGEIHESDVKDTKLYRKLIFEKHRIVMDGTQFSLHQSQGGLRGERELGVDTMSAIVDSIKSEQNVYYTNLVEMSKKHFLLDSAVVLGANPHVKVNDKSLLYIRILNKINAAKNIMLANSRKIEWANREIEKYEVEVYKKYSIPAACIVFLLIGAPLAIMVRNGGFGVAASISLFFFLIYWAFLIGGEKLAERGFFSPFIGMWAANFVLGVVGIILTYKTNQETITISFRFFRKLVPKRLRFEQTNNENT